MDASIILALTHLNSLFLYLKFNLCNIEKSSGIAVCVCDPQVVVESDVTMQCEDFKMIFRGRVGSKR